MLFRSLATRWEDGRTGGTTALVTRVARVELPTEHRAAVAEVLAGSADAAKLDPDVHRSLCVAGVLVPASP